MCLATIFTIADVSLGSPVNHHEHEASIVSDSVLERPLDSSEFHAIARTAVPDESNRHLWRKRDMPDPSNHLPPTLIQHHDHITDHLQLHSSSSSLAKRSLISDLTFMGFRLIWDHADMIVSSSLAYYRTTEFYKNITILAGGEFGFGPTVQNYVITYGCFRLTFSIIVDAVGGIAGELAREFPGGFGQFMQDFAKTMLILVAGGVVVGGYAILAISVTISVWITMVIGGNPHSRNTITGP